ncbi:MAG TPA: lipopolysaccharide biosynthesis protein, partial [Phaeodactylibacter sp.]|nr:lipopolysaccharide biosynthesis protein [Phaeodactylibacter sp.]
MSLKNKTIKGFLWNALGKISEVGSEFVIGIILARLLSPREFGLVGMIMVFIALSEVLINSGLKQALIRKTACSQKDYSTVFFFNIAIGIFCYGI